MHGTSISFLIKYGYALIGPEPVGAIASLQNSLNLGTDKTILLEVGVKMIPLIDANTILIGSK